MAYSILSVTKMTSAQLATYTGAEGMIVINTDTDSISVLDGTKAGGYSLPNEDTVQSYVNTQVNTIMTSGGQVLPAAATTTGNVVTWDGGNWQEDSTFAQKSYVDTEISNIKPTSPSGSGQAVQWDGSKFINFTLPTTSGGGGGGVTVTVPATPAGSSLVWDGTDFQNRSGYAMSTDVTTAINNVKGTASLSYDTLGKLENFIKNNNTVIATKALKPTSASGANEVLAWDSSLNSGDGGFIQKDLSGLAEISTATTYTNLATVENKFNTLDASLLTYAKKGTAATYTDLGLIETKINSIDTNLPNYALKGTAATYTDLGLVETELGLKAPKPPNGIQAGEFLRWDETNGVFTFATPAGGGGGSTIPTPSATTDYSTAGSMQVLVWDQTSGDLKNVSSPFAELGSVTTLTDLASAEAAINAKADAPPTQTTTNTYLYHDGTSWQYGTPVSSGITGPASGVTPAGSALTWDGTDLVNTSGFATESWVNTGLTAKADASDLTTGLTNTETAANNYTDTQVAAKADKPSTASNLGEFLSWNGSTFVSSTPSGVSFTTPTAPTGSSEFVKWDGNDFVNAALSVSGYTDMGSITPPSASVGNEALQWDGSDFVNVSGFATESFVTGKMPSGPSALDEIVQWDGTNLVNVSGFAQDSDITDRMPSGATPTGSVVTWDGSRLQNTVGMATEAYVNNLKPANPTGSSELVKWNGASFENATLSTTGFTTTGFITPATTSGSTDVLQWNGSNFINVSGFAQMGSASTLTDLGLVETAVNTKANIGSASTLTDLGLVEAAVNTKADVGTASTLTNLGLVETAVNSKADAPPTQTTSGSYLYHDGSSWQYGTPVSGGGGISGPAGGVTPSGSALTWDGSALQNTSGFALVGTASTLTNLGLIETAVNGKADVGAASTLTDLGLIETAVNSKANVGSASTLTDLGLVETAVNGKANIGSASTLTDLGLVETAVNGKAATPPTQTTTGTYLYHDGTNWQYGTAAATEAYVDTAISNLLGGASTAYDTLKEIEDYITNNSDTNMTSLLNDLALKVSKPAASTPADHVLVYNATSGALETKDWMGAGIWEVVDNGTEYVVQLKAGAVPA